MDRQLRNYQSDCHEAVIEEYENGITRPLITLFTGAGKTFLLIKLLERMGFKRVLWLSFQTELIDQTALAFCKEKYDSETYRYIEELGFLNWVELDRYSNVDGFGNFQMGCVKAELFQPMANVIMGSVMTVVNRLDKLHPEHFDAIICDEAHLFMSNSSQKVLNHFSPKILIGCTATATRADGLPLSDIFQKIVYDYDLGRGIKDGWACEMDAVRIKTTTSLDKVKTTAGDLNIKDLSNEINTLSRNQLIVDSYKKYCEGRPCIAFCSDIKHAVDLAEQFRMNGYDCQAVSSNEELTPNRSKNIKNYKEGRLNIITNVNILVAGFDMIDTGCAIMACPTKSLTKYLQAVGRSSRLKNKWYVDKFGQNAIILDIVDLTSRHNLVNAWELDKEKAVEDRWFVSQEKKDKLLAERARKTVIEFVREKDEVVSLLSIPKLKISKSYKMSEDATPLQLSTIEKWGYDVKTIHYTKSMVAEIFGKQSVHSNTVRELESWGYDCKNKFVSIAEHQLAKKEYEERQLKNKRKKV